MSLSSFLFCVLHNRFSSRSVVFFFNLACIGRVQFSSLIHDLFLLKNLCYTFVLYCAKESSVCIQLDISIHKCYSVSCLFVCSKSPR